MSDVTFDEFSKAFGNIIREDFSETDIDTIWYYRNDELTKPSNGITSRISHNQPDTYLGKQTAKYDACMEEYGEIKGSYTSDISREEKLRLLKMQGNIWFKLNQIFIKLKKMDV